jgi:hypothetical protein
MCFTEMIFVVKQTRRLGTNNRIISHRRDKYKQLRNLHNIPSSASTIQEYNRPTFVCDTRRPVALSLAGDHSQGVEMSRVCSANANGIFVHKIYI